MISKLFPQASKYLHIDERARVRTICNIGQWLNGKTIDRILIAYDRAPDTGGFVCWLDDIELTDGFPSGTYKIINHESGRGLDLTGFNTADGNNIQVWSYGGGWNQKWRIDDKSGSANGPVHRIDCAGVNKALHAGDPPGRNVKIWTWHPEWWQQYWTFAPVGHRYAILSSYSSDGDYMTETGAYNGAPVIHTPWVGSNAQLWYIQAP